MGMCGSTRRGVPIVIAVAETTGAAAGMGIWILDRRRVAAGRDDNWILEKKSRRV